MSLGHCSCPECGTTLRIRDRSFIGREVDCPDCQTKLLIRLDDDRKVIAERPKVEPKAAPKRDPLPAEKSTPGLGKKIQGVVHSPLVLAWSLAIGVTAFVAIVMLRPNVRFRTPVKETSPPVVASDTPSEPDPSPEVPPVSPAVVPEPSTPAETQKEPADSVVGKTDVPPADVPPADVPAPVNPTAVVTTPAETKPKAVIVPPVRINVDALLKQRLQKFSTRQPVSRFELIETVEGMLGAPIRYNRSELGEKNLERPMSIELEATTVGGVLKVLLESAGWEYVVEDDCIRLKPRQVAGSEKP